MKFERPEMIGHAWILSSPSREEALRAAGEIAQAAVCLADRNVPCGICRGCRKAAAGNHPDIIRLRRETDKSGKLRKNLTVDQIRTLSLDAQVLPGEARRKVFIIEEAELMNPNAQNAALKLLEEPPASVVFLLCVPNPELLLETVRSRCTMRNLAAAEESGDEAARKLADGFLDAVCSGEPERLYRWVAKNESAKLEETRAFVEEARQRTADMLCGRIPCGVLSPEQQMALWKLLSRCADYLSVNVNAKHIFSLLVAESLNGVTK